MAAPFFSVPFQPYVYQSPQSTVTPFQILGGESQILQIMLKSQDKVTSKPGTMCYLSGSIEINNTYFPEQDGGIWQWLFGKNIISIVFSNTGPDDGYVGISAPSPARIIPIDLANFGGEMLCQADAFLCSLNDVKVSNVADQRARNITSGSEVVLKQKLVGQGLAFLVGGGSVVQKILDVGEVVVVDAACIVAMTSTINFQVKYSHPVRRSVFGGDHQLTASLTGPGVVFIQSLPFHRLSQRIARAVTPQGMRDNPKFFIQIAIFFFLAYVMIVSSLILTDV
ncbi:hypothetical protein HPP92_007952 [Vanilla planifolia]|uniref:Altered inheritance of mitochondria protein 24, mitochondrial n=1 Tax=Vanilla planifolia TaxID=51239 RepID=A0A835RHE2_VANPL|nr:hypothetical protein HPP92_007932 [Vanilla planifolia]KAG0489141.1 hypothetical protein HPP92_007952 [Vanilla planifolia]